MSNKQYPSVAELERRALRSLIWVVPPALALALPYVRAHLWAFIALDPQAAIDLTLRSRLILGGAGALLGLGLILGWRIGLKLTPRTVGRLSLVLALAATVAVEAAVRHPSLVDLLWGGVRIRASENADFFIRETALFRRMALRNSDTAKPRLLVVGSSQLIIGVDYETLEALRPEFQIERRCIAAMSASRMLMASPLLGARSNDTVLVYWSEFDMGGAGTTDTSWYRPLSNKEGLNALYDEMPVGRRFHDWRDLIELSWANLSELWRSRDAWRIMLMYSMGQPTTTPPVEAGEAKAAEDRGEPANDRISGQIDNYRMKLKSDAAFEMGLRSAARMIRDWRSKGARVIILEGSVNPLMHQPRTPERREQARELLRGAAREFGAVYVPASEQDYIPADDHWKDGTHLNEEGRGPFTAYIGALVQEAK